MSTQQEPQNQQSHQTQNRNPHDGQPRKPTAKKPKGITLQTFLIKLGYEDLANKTADDLYALKFAAVVAIATKGDEKMIDKALQAVGVRRDENQKR